MAQPRTLVYMTLDEVPDADVNPKQHDMRTLGESVDRFGFVEPIIIDERTGKLVSGHGRKADLRSRQAMGEDAPEGITVTRENVWKVPVIRGWESRDDAEAAAFLVATNRVGERGGWNNELLVEVLGPLAADANVDLLAGTGYSSADLNEMLKNLEPTAEPEPPANFPPIGDIETEHTCPKCGYEF